MEDYKALIKKLRELDADVVAKMGYIQQAADAIEQLAKERDAAVADLTEQRGCHVCKYSKTNIDYEPVRHGHWMERKTATGNVYTVCSKCNTCLKYKDEYGFVLMNLSGTDYCPKCGAKMDEEV